MAFHDNSHKVAAMHHFCHARGQKKVINMQFPHIAILGAGTIGLSWAALFAATGRQVTISDPSPDPQKRFSAFVDGAADALSALGWTQAGDLSRVTFVSDPAEAVRDADFIQESIPENLDLKHELYSRIEQHLKAGAIIGTSTSGLRLSDLQKGLSDPSRLVLAHPFNPPHLIPLVEIMGNDLTDERSLNAAWDFYESLGKVCVRLHKEVPGHIANRLQAAIWRESINLAMEGVASLADIDKAVAYGPGLRWAAFGPTTLFHLGGGEGGIRNFSKHIGPHVETWWNDLGAPQLTPDVVDRLAGEMEALNAKSSPQDLAQRRDRLVLQYIMAGLSDAKTS
ncbi:3-hydroxyacyl-CoA dehydrogenase family protein [Paracoccus albus]|uniref:3-hydroxyacyl-CoA dehydrogenase family protein n=1 Tax=Paracoccus albus TaxID=3017784 RepID=UPI0022F1202B|nr:3-hydroxyacyl-CoA dehydrogenase NAD-binding domain-containing protein [Paracoccus albus]WBU61653.1 3-hydroxyacyl-CoA dehydrogenase NAD-binding domain-containing protein [Paracoccus albus]